MENFKFNFIRNKTLRSVHFGVVAVELINCKCGRIVRMKMARVRCSFVKIWDLWGYSEKSNIQEANCLWDIRPVMLWWLHTNPSKFDLGLNDKSNMRLLVVNNKSNKTNSEKRILHFSYISLQKQHSSLMYWLKICEAWVRSQLC